MTVRATEGLWSEPAARWFGEHAGASSLRALIDGGAAAERAAWARCDEFGLAELLADERDPEERARIIAQVAVQAGRVLYAGPLIEGHARTWLGTDECDARIATALCARTTSDRAIVYVPHAGAADCCGVLVYGTDGSEWLSWSGAMPATTLRVVADGSTLLEAQSAALATVGVRRMPIAETHADEWRAIVWMATAARLLGVAQAAAALARDYLLTRTQFGRPLASFQVLQHQAVDRHGEIAAAEALLDRVLEHWSDRAVRGGALHALKAYAARTAVAAAKTCVQHFGAMGFSHEGDAGLYLRHAISLAARHGDEHAHRAAFAGARLSLWD